MSPASNVWSTKVPSLQLAWDAHSLNRFMECPRKYYYEIIRSLRPKRARLVPLYGQLLHLAIQRYHKRVFELSKDLPHPDSLSNSWPDIHDEACIAALDVALSPEARPLWLSGEPERTPFTLARAVIWYLDLFQNDPAKTVVRKSDGSPAVELQFAMDIGRLASDETLLWCGYIDRLAVFDGNPVVTDYKTTKYALDDRWASQFHISLQISGYIAAASTFMPFPPDRQAIIDGFELKANFNRYKRFFTSRNDDQLTEWLQLVHHWISLAVACAESEIWPMNLSSCDKYGGCVFRDRVCSKTPNVRDMWIQGDFEEGLPWNPLEIRD
jgi:hypothetical protein